MVGLADGLVNFFAADYGVGCLMEWVFNVQWKGYLIGIGVLDGMGCIWGYEVVSGVMRGPKEDAEEKIVNERFAWNQFLSSRPNCKWVLVLFSFAKSVGCP